MADAALTIERREDGGRGEYIARHPDSEETARLTWIERGDTRVANHTYTPPALRGRNIAAQLVEALILDAREQGFKIVPQCSYVEAQFRRHPEWSDLRA